MLIFEKNTDESVTLYKEAGTAYMIVQPTATVTIDGNYIVITGGGIPMGSSVRDRYNVCYNLAQVSLGDTPTEVVRALNTSYFYNSSEDILVSLDTIDTKIDVIDTNVDTILAIVLSVLADTDYMQKVMFAPTLVYPFNVAGITVTAAAGAYNMGALTQIVPAGTITSEFVISYLIIDSVSIASNYIIELYYGDADTFLSRVRYRSSVEATLRIDSPVIPANSKISAKLASLNIATPTNNLCIAYKPLV